MVTGMFANRIEFNFGVRDLVLALPPFFIDFEKYSISSLVTHRPEPSREKKGVYIFVFITKSLQAEKLSILKEMHPDIKFLEGVKKDKDAVITDEVKDFKSAIERLEKEWSYVGNGVWAKNFDSVTVNMLLIVDEDRWTIRPAVSRKGMSVYNVEIPVETPKAKDFAKVLKEEELEEIHDHNITQHFHLIVKSLDRYVKLVKKWDYYFSKDAVWPPLFEVMMI
jgi:hypothetical protein